MRIARSAYAWLYDRRRRLATAGMGVLAGLLLFHVVSGANGVFVYANKRSEYKKVRQEMEQLQQENDQLNQNIHSLKTDPKAIEKEAREQLKYARPGEIIYTTPPARPAPSSAASTAAK